MNDILRGAPVLLRRRLLLVLTVTTALVISGRVDAQPVTAVLDYGPHAVGFRALTELDYSRTVQPRVAFDGKPAAGETAMPIEISIWYPAVASTPDGRMSAGGYKAVRTPGGGAPATAAAEFRRMAEGGGLTLTDAEANEALARPTRAYRDAAPASGSFPVIISGGYPGTGWIRNEYLASHGYVVIAAPGSLRTATLQASQPAVALETQTRNLEFLFAFAQRQRFVDASRVGALGVNFDGMAALVFQMRTMRADAVVSLDGYEAKAGNTTMLRELPYFDPLRMRVPYLLFVQNEPDPSPSLVHDRAIWNALPYSTRFWYVLKDLNHAQLISDIANAATLSPAHQTAHRFVLKTMRQFFDGYVKKDASAIAALTRSPQENGLPPALAVAADRAAGLPPVPDGEEFERLVMSGAIEDATRIYRQARRANPGLDMFDESTIDLYAFRYTQRKAVKEALAIRQLGAEAFPHSPTAQYQLGIAALNAEDAADARSAFTRALGLLDAASGISAERKTAIREDIQKRLAAIGAQ